MDYLKDGIGLRGMGQRDPLVEYQREGYQMYNSMIDAIKEQTVQLLFNVDLKQIAASQENERRAREERKENEEGQSEPVNYQAPEEPDAEDETTDIEETAEERDEGAPAGSVQEDSEEDSDKDSSEDIAEASETDDASAPAPVGPAPISHAEGKVPANKRPKAVEDHSPWADGRTFPGTPRNAPCPCGSGRKYKMCHGQNEKK